MDQLEKVVSKITNEFETKPIVTTVKTLVVLWVVKQAIKIIKSE